MAYTREQWNKAKAYFEAGKSLTYISDTLEINKSNISRRASKEKWIKGKINIHNLYVEQKQTNRIIAHENKIDITVVKELTKELVWYTNEEIINHINGYPYYLSCRLENLSKIELILMFEMIKDEMYFGPDKNVSKGHLKVREYLNTTNLIFEEEKKFPKLKNIQPLRFDFYIEELNIAIEFNGKQHYEPIDLFGGKVSYKKQVVNDNLKRKFCKANNIKLIEIGYFDIMNIQKILSKEL